MASSSSLFYLGRLCVDVRVTGVEKCAKRQSRYEKGTLL